MRFVCVSCSLVLSSSFFYDRQQRDETRRYDLCDSFLLDFTTFPIVVYIVSTKILLGDRDCVCVYVFSVQRRAAHHFHPPARFLHLLYK